MAKSLLIKLGLAQAEIEKIINDDKTRVFKLMDIVLKSCAKFDLSYRCFQIVESWAKNKYMKID